MNSRHLITRLFESLNTPIPVINCIRSKGEIARSIVFGSYILVFHGNTLKIGSLLVVLYDYLVVFVGINRRLSNEHNLPGSISSR